MRPRHEASENRPACAAKCPAYGGFNEAEARDLGKRWRSRRESRAGRRFNEAEARGLGKHRSPAVPRMSVNASMRPRHEASENRGRDPPAGDEGAVASMRPRHEASENLSM